MNIKPFNRNYKIMTVFYFVLGAFVCRYVSNLDEVSSWSFMLKYSLFLLAYVFIYRKFLWFNKEYNMIVYGKPISDIFNELLLFPCNVCTLFYFLGFYFKTRALINFSFFISLSAILALVFPSDGCDEGSFLKPRIWCFYTTHYMLILEAFLLIKSHLYIPTYKDALDAVLLYETVSLVIFLINRILRKTGLNKKANYFFNVEPDGNPVLESFYKLVPIPYIYTFLPALVFLAIFVAITFVLHIFVV